MKKLLTPCGNFEGKTVFDLWKTIPAHKFGWIYGEFCEKWDEYEMNGVVDWSA